MCQRRAEVGRGEHQEALDRRAGGVEVAGQPVAQHQGAGAVHHHVNRARCPRQSLGGPGAIQGGGEVGVGDVVLQGDPVGEADLRRRAAEPGFQLLGEAAERLRIVAPAVDDDDRTGHVRHPLGLIRATIDHAPRRRALTCENVRMRRSPRLPPARHRQRVAAAGAGRLSRRPPVHFLQPLQPADAAPAGARGIPAERGDRQPRRRRSGAGLRAFPRAVALSPGLISGCRRGTGAGARCAARRTPGPASLALRSRPGGGRSHGWKPGGRRPSRG